MLFKDHWIRIDFITHLFTHFYLILKCIEQMVDLMLDISFFGVLKNYR